VALETLQERFTAAVGQITQNFVGGLADFLVVLIFLGVGYLVARALAGIVERGLKEMRLEKKLAEKGVHDALMGFTVTEIIKTLVKLSTFAVFLGIAAGTVRLDFITFLTMWFLGYLPNLLQGVTILVVALIGVDYVADRLKKAADIPFPKLLALSVKIFVGYTALVVSLPLILPGADVSILKDFFTLIVAGFALAFGLGSAIAIGLGMKDSIANVTKKKEKELEKILG